MLRMFFSYSWAQEDIVTNVANSIGRDFVIQDKCCFEDGRALDDEMKRKIDCADMFVIFLSKESIKSPNVLLELDYVSALVYSKKILFCPILIDEDVVIGEDWGRYDWIKDYLLTFTKCEKRIERLVLQKIRQLAGKKIGGLPTRFFKGRELDKAAITKDFFYSVNNTRRVLIVSGVPRIGRKSLIVETLLTSLDQTLPECYEPISVSLDENDSLDSLTVQLAEYVDESIYCGETFGHIDTLIKILSELQKNNQKILIDDSKCIVQRDGGIVDWFQDILLCKDLVPYTYFFIASEHSVATFFLHKYSQLQTYNLHSLTRDDMRLIFTTYCKLRGITCSEDNTRQFIDSFTGYPQLILNVVDDIAKSGVELAKRYMNNNIKYFAKENIRVLDELKADEQLYQLTILLSRFEFISYDILCDLMPDVEVASKLESLYCYSLIEQFGSERQYYRLNHGLSDHIARNQIPLCPEYEKNFKDLGSRSLAAIEDEYLDLSDKLFSIKEKIKSDPQGIDSSMLLPSYTLKVIIELYHKKDYPNIILLAERILNDAHHNVYESVIRSIKYWLCLACARINNKTVFENHIDYFYSEKGYNATFYFLKGFYERCQFHYSNARRWYEKSLACTKDRETSRYLAKVHHELVLVYIKLDEPEALDLARRNYEIDNSNAYHIESYYRCLVRSDNPSLDMLAELIESMRASHDIYKDVIVDTFEAEYKYYIEGRKLEAINVLKQIISDYPKTIQYPIDALKHIMKRERTKGKACDDIQAIIKKNGDCDDIYRFD